eukprot:CAMPEP_0194723148 /NCGR_PEP_ID=MMETSP0296-20130528/14199_1 /TAXON_ID=39354 /ORGANISM="Heterosigma akashiwo, Strain CCMP2393" /LENGTH=724 /DNA_ID=CAMNT_0039626455 /DNA_START=94 /DNA_END=2264 /DNA_ORIENTATION=+
MATALVDIGNKMETLDQENGFQLISPPKKQAPPMDVVDASVTEEEGKADGDHITESMIRAQEQAKDEAAKVLEKEEAAPAEVHAPTLLQADPEVDQAHAPATAAGRKSQLDFLLQKAEAFSGFINGCQAEVQDRLSAQCQEEAAKEEQAAASPAAAGGRKRKKGQRASPRQRAKQKQEAAAAAEGAMAEADAKMAAAKGEAEGRPAFRQPRRMTGGTLKGYQLEGLRWLASLYENGLSGILADEMGLGKTIQVIAFLAYLTEMGVSGPFLVAAPLATLPNWVLEFQKWVPDLPVALYHGSKEERAQLRRRRLRPADQRKPQFPIVITSYEICIIDRPYLQNYNFKFMVIDEGQRIKNRNCRLVRELKQIPSESRLLLSGTPIQNTLEELWTLLNFVNPAIFDDLTVFQGWFGFRNIGKETQVDDILDGEARGRIVTKLHEILRPFLLRRLKKDVLTRMPPKREVVVYAPMTQLQLDYTALIHQGGLRDALLQMGIEGAAALTEINKTMNLRKAANHPFLFGEPRTDGGEYVGEAHPELMAAASGKLALFDRMLADLRRGGHKTLVFSQMTSVLDLLEDLLRWRGVQYARLDGSVSVQDRQARIQAFNADPAVEVFLLSTRAGGLGINLAAADTCVIFDSDWNPHQDSQAQDRAHRLGQTRPVAVYRLVSAGSVEVEMMEKAVSKKKLERMAIVGGDFRQAGRRASRALTAANLRTLLEDDVRSL